MAIELSKETRVALISSIQSYFDEQMDDEIGQMKAGFLLDYFLKEIGPAVYNQAIRDAAAYFQEKAGDLDHSCYEPEMTFWQK